jgi:hypothetical protein
MIQKTNRGEFMKTLLCLVCVMYSLTASAGFHQISKKLCNGDQVELTKQERVYIDLDKAILGFGQTNDQDCKTVDFTSVLIESLSHSTVIGMRAEVLSVSAIGRRSSCEDGLVPFAGISNFKASIEDDRVTVYSDELSDCEEMTLFY